MNDKKPTVSIIVPVYKTEAYLEKCVESIRSQSFSDWELLLVDDGSPDGSGALCDLLAGRDARIRVIHKENGGVSSARNAGLKAAAGSFVSFIDSDDWIEPGMIAWLLQKKEESGADLIGCGYAAWYGEEKRLPCRALPEKRMKAEDFLAEALRTDCGVNLSCCVWLFPRDLIVSQCFEQELPYGEDALFLCTALKKAGNIYYEPEPLYDYLMDRAGNTVTEMSAAKSRKVLSAWERIRSLFPENEGPLGHVLTKILAEKAVETCRLLRREEGMSGESRKARGLSARLTARLLPWKDIRSKDKLRLLLSVLSPVIGVELWQKMTGAAAPAER